MRANRLRIKKVRDEWEITTYAAQARGARRRLMTLRVKKQDIERTLNDPEVLKAFGIRSPETS